MSAIVAYQGYLRRVSPSLVVAPAAGAQTQAAATPASSVSSLATSGGAASALRALLGRTGLSGPDGATVAGSTAAPADPADAKAKLQKALTTLLDALNRGTSDATASQSAPVVDDAIQTVLGALSPIAPATTTAAATVTTVASGQDVAAATPKPNLDALHRVLTHYTAQSAAASTVVTLVR